MRFDSLSISPDILENAQMLLSARCVTAAKGPAREEELCYTVKDGDKYLVAIRTPTEYTCSCGSETPCVHMAAAQLKAASDGRLEAITRKTETRLGEKMLLALEHSRPGAETMRMSVHLRVYADGRLGLAINLGRERLYAVKNIQEMLTCRALSLPLILSEKFTCEMSDVRFRKEDESLLSLLESFVPLKADMVWEHTGSMPDTSAVMPKSDGRWLMLEGAFRRSVLKHLETQPFVLQTTEEKYQQNYIHTAELPLCFSISAGTTELVVTVQGLENVTALTPDARYVLQGEKLVRLESDQARVCRLLLREGTTLRYQARDMQYVLETLLPAFSAMGTVLPDPALKARMHSEPFRGQVYLDAVNGSVQARVLFCYGDLEIDPFSTQHPEQNTAENEPVKLLVRDGRSESTLMDLLSEAGFVVRGTRAILHRPKDILAFCTQGISELSAFCEVYASQDFEKIKPRRLKARTVFHMNGGRLVMTMLEESGELPEVVPVLKAIARRQQYVRLKTGEFLDLRDMNALAPVVQEVLDAAMLDEPSLSEEAREIRFSAYRTAYMLSMLRLAGTEVEADSEVEETANSLIPTGEEARSLLPEPLAGKLTPYQLRGYDWIMSLYEGRMGGILADEMGLGKTAQVIAALSGTRHRDGAEKSLIVTPTSLTYHWLAEFKRFDDSLTVRIVTGPREQRRQTLHEIAADDSVDVILTSYPLLRRDIDLIKPMNFRFAVLDEAQSVKNAQSQGASAAKDINARTRLALTGTPMENYTGELWSIFDFVLPGYLGTQLSFLRRYGSGEHAEELRDRVRPFLMRRLKKDVMSDLPEKHEQDLYVAMTPEQEQVYNSLLATLRASVGEALDSGSLPRARMQVLSLLLKLRQVCCHPKLFLSDYEGTSGKLELLVQTVHDAIISRRRMLIFSQFVGMLQLIRKRLAREGVQALYLDGQTGPEERQRLCDRFNSGEGQVFLISLKAGGTGLNLIGADLVIHYDPWWNPAAENQATDRAHRIGQTRDVDVIRMISQGTIEEKVTELSRRKRAIFDRVIMAGEAGLNTLTEEDIRMLFFN